MIRYYDLWKGNRTSFTELSINSPDVKKHLNSSIIFNKELPMLSVCIDDFPNEAGYSMLLELSISEDADSKMIIPVFINDNGSTRPLSCKRIMDKFLSESTNIYTPYIKQIDYNLYELLEKKSKDFAYQSLLNY